MKTSKIKSIKEIKPYNNDYGTTYYHLCEMENGDKISIGKKKELQTGWEVAYELIGDPGQHEFTKAKSVKPEPKKDDNYVKGIEVGHAINNAVNLICAGAELEFNKEFRNTDEKIYEYAKRIMQISERLKNE